VDRLVIATDRLWGWIFSSRIRPVRVALRNQRDDLLAFAGVLDKKLAGNA
jgi:hypothetical protein